MPNVVTAEPRSGAVTRAERPPPLQRHAVYIELLGKGGLYGIGYDVQLSSGFGLGITGSAYIVDDQRVLTLSPYLSVHLIAGRRHRWFAHLGPRLSSVALQSNVPQWTPPTKTGAGAQLATGWEYRNRILVRTFVVGVAGRGGIAPWAGTSIGVAF